MMTAGPGGAGGAPQNDGGTSGCVANANGKSCPEQGTVCADPSASGDLCLCTAEHVWSCLSGLVDEGSNGCPDNPAGKPCSANSPICSGGGLTTCICGLNLVWQCLL
jgi:hypothetical protein